jgi:myo-inositol-1(or 4)-monophosphatase
MNPTEGHRSTPVDAGWLRALVLEAGNLMQEASGRRGDLRVDLKGRVDLVTETDLAIQDLLTDAIASAFPGDLIIAEEGDVAGPAATDRVWYVDPLDGTTNFVHGHPFCAVSVARWVGGSPEIGAVYAPMLDELFMAVRGGGARFERPVRGDAPISIGSSACRSLDDALLGTGFPYHRGASARVNLCICARALTRARGLRRAGSAALDLCHVGLGRLDGYWEMGLNAWDVAAATLVAREAGAKVTDFLGRESVLGARRIIAAPPPIHGELIGMISEAHAAPDLDPLGAVPVIPVPLDGPLPTELG